MAKDGGGGYRGTTCRPVVLLGGELRCTDSSSQPPNFERTSHAIHCLLTVRELTNLASSYQAWPTIGGRGVLGSV